MSSMYLDHERERTVARVRLMNAVLDDVEARVRASSEPHEVGALPIASALLDWEVRETQEMRDLLLGAFGWDDDAGEEEPDPFEALTEARAVLQSYLNPGDPIDLAALRASDIRNGMGLAAGVEDPEDDDDECTCVTTSVPSVGGDGYGGSFTDQTGCPVHDPDYDDDDREPDIDDWTPPDYGPPGSGAIVIEYEGNEPGLEDYPPF